MEKRALTPDDPVDTETLEQFHRLTETRAKIADDLLSLEQDKIQLLLAAKKIDEQRTRLFEACLIDRGLPLDAAIEIDRKTGKITLTKSEAEEE